MWYAVQMNSSKPSPSSQCPKIYTSTMSLYQLLIRIAKRLFCITVLLEVHHTEN
jgi:hypothetical protein